MAEKQSSSRAKLPRVKKRKAIDLEQKMRIIKQHEGGQPLSSIAREFSLAFSTVNTILKDSVRIKEHVKNSASLKATVITKQRSSIIYKMESILSKWMDHRIEMGVPLSFMIIQNKAKKIFDSLKEKSGDTKTNFRASYGWFNRFKARSNFHNLNESREIPTLETLENDYFFHDKLAKIIQHGGYVPEQIFNIDETSLLWKELPKCFYRDEESSIDDNCLTLLLGSNATGDCKLKPVLVYNSENPRAFQGISKATLPVHFRFNIKASFTTALFEDWFINCFIPEAEKYCYKKRIPFKILLILDDALSHPSHLDDFHPDVKVVYIPPDATSDLQPMNQKIISAFKMFYLYTTFAQALAVVEFGKTFFQFWVSYNIYQAILNINTAWEEVTIISLKSAWKNICPQFNLSKSTNNDVMFNEIMAKIINLARNLGVEIDETDVKKYIENGILGDDMMEIKKRNMDGQVKTENLEKSENKLKHFIAEEMLLAFREINSAMARFESMDPNVSRFSKVNKLIQDALVCYKDIYDEKKKDMVTQPVFEENVIKIELS